MAHASDGRRAALTNSGTVIPPLLALSADGTYNLQFINDFIRNAIKQQVRFSKSTAKTCYGMKPAYNYWNGCSTGGRQGYLLAQELGTELDRILANAPEPATGFFSVLKVVE